MNLVVIILHCLVGFGECLNSILVKLLRMGISLEAEAQRSLTVVGIGGNEVKPGSIVGEGSL